MKKEITKRNLLKLVKEYTKSVIPNASEPIEQFFTSVNFSDAFVQPLSNSCVVLKNKLPNSTGKQTHIHVTGNSRLFFYSESELNDISNQNDKKVAVDVNLDCTHNLENNFVSDAVDFTVVPSFTYTKVAFRSKEKPQVQVSKTSIDGSDFMELRNNLHIDDLLIILKYAHTKDKYFAIGIPEGFYNNKYYVTSNHLSQLEGHGNISVKTVLSEIENSIDSTAMIDNSNDIEDSIYQQLINNSEDDDESEDTTIDYNNDDYSGNSNGHNVHSNRPSTNPKLGQKAIKLNKYKCIFASSNAPHETFEKSNGKPYMEAHHIIPVGKQSEFKKKLDTIGNIVPVCPLCHRKLHHGRITDVNDLLEHLYSIRKDILKQSGLDITLEKLQEYYRQS